MHSDMHSLTNVLFVHFQLDRKIAWDDLGHLFVWLGDSSAGWHSLSLLIALLDFSLPANLYHRIPSFRAVLEAGCH